MSEHFAQIHFRRPRSSDRIGLILVAIVMIVLIVIGITPAVMPGRK